MPQAKNHDGRFQAGPHPARPIGRGGSNQRESLASPDSPSHCASLATPLSPVGCACGEKRQYHRNRRVKGQPVLFGAAVCHPEQFFPPHFCSATEQTRWGMLFVVYVFPFIIAAVLFLSNALSCPPFILYICFSLPIHIRFLSVDCCIMVPPLY